MEALPDLRDQLAAYRERLEEVEPDALGRNEALAFWANLYNVGALELAAEARERGEPTVLQVDPAFGRPFTTVAGEELSLNDVEHGKVRRFRDARIHGALVCGTASCPTLRPEPFGGAGLDAQLEEQMRRFIGSGGIRIDRSAGRVLLSRIFRWYSGDFVWPHRMPTWIPAPRRRVLDVVLRWVSREEREWIATERPEAVYQRYDWTLQCAVG